MSGIMQAVQAGVAALTMVTGMIWLGAMPAAAMYTVALPAGCQPSDLGWYIAAK
jgi:hypothetical protein